MAEFEIKIEGSSALHAALTERREALDRAARLFVEDSMDILQRGINEQLRITSHPLGTPTPSQPGEPPSLVLGDLARSVQQYGPYYEGAHKVSGVVGVGAVQARIQELGGDTGRDHATHLPARPYVAPAVEVAKPEIADSAREHFGAAVRGEL